MDVIIGKDGRGAIVTLVERSKDYLLMRKLPQGKNAEALARIVVAMMTPFIGNIHSITTDNGSEFACHKLIAQRLKTKRLLRTPLFFMGEGKYRKYEQTHQTIHS